MRRFLAFTISLAILFSGLSAPVASANGCSLAGTATEVTGIGTCSGAITIPDGVTSIAAYAFIQVETLISITIPASVSSIGVGAFQEATSLTSVTFSGTSVLTAIANSTFAGTAITSIIIPASVTSIGGSVFERARSLASITFASGSQLTSIGNFAFDRTALTSITIPAGVTSIGSAAFKEATFLASVTFESDSTLLSIGDEAFYEVGFRLTSFVIPTSVTSIGSNAFAYTGITSFTIPASVTSIGDSAFIGYSGLESFTVAEANTNFKSVDSVLFNKNGTTLIAYPASRAGSSYTIPAGVTSIGGRAFFGASAPTSITIPSSVTSIGYQSFYSTDGLASIVIPATVTSIDNNAFQSSGIRSITITSSTTSIGEDAFYGTALESVRFLGNDVPTSVSSSLSAPATAKAVVNNSATKANFPLVAGKWNGLIVVTVAEFEGDNAPAAPSAETLAAAARAAARAAEAARASARSDLATNSFTPLTVEKFASAVISGVTAKNIGAVSAEIEALSTERRGEISEILKIARKFEVVDIVASSARVSASMLQEIGLIRSDNKNRSSITVALAKLPSSERASFSAIESAIATVMKKVQARQDRLAAIKARIRR